MPLPPEHTRIDVLALKSQISYRLGPDRSRRYFNSLNRLLAQKLSKRDFERFCISTLGRENISLHNELVLAILKNACLGKSPPPAPPPATFKSTTSPALIRLNGDILPPSPRKVRSGIRRIKDRLSPLGPNGRTEIRVHHNLVASDELVTGGTRSSPPCDLKRTFSHSKSGDEAVTIREREEVGPLSAPLGIPFCHASVGGARKSMPLFTAANYSDFSCNYDSGELCHTEELKKRMERIAEAHELGGVTMECANLLNNGIDAYLKRLIKSCVELVAVKPSLDPVSHLYNQQRKGKLINGVSSGSSNHLQGSDSCTEALYMQRGPQMVSLDDFKVAMELNPQQLGEDWPLLLEKICICSFEN